MKVAALALLFVFALETAWSDIESLRKEAGAFVAAGEIESAMTRYAEIINLNADDAAAHFQLGVLSMDKNENTQKAQASIEKAAELGFAPGPVAFRLSRIHARNQRESQALEQLEKLVSIGFAIPKLIEGQADYDSIKDKPRFKAALQSMQVARFPCKFDERFQAFDFWIGDWDVSQNGQFAGHDKIVAILAGCVLLENWESATGSRGKSFSFYDASMDKWRQVWVTDSGSVVDFFGEAREGGIYYQARTKNPTDGSPVFHKFEFTQNSDGTIRQHWQTSSDNKKSWATVWDGLFVRSSEVEALKPISSQ